MDIDDHRTNENDKDNNTKHFILKPRPVDTKVIANKIKRSFEDIFSGRAIQV